MNHQELYDRIDAICRESSRCPPLKVEPSQLDGMVFIESEIFAGTMDKLVKEFSLIDEGVAFVDGKLMVYG